MKTSVKKKEIKVDSITKVHIQEDSIKVKKKIEITKNSDFKGSYSAVDVFFTHGFEKTQHFRILLNNKLIKDCYWKTNYYVDDTSGDEIFYRNLKLRINYSNLLEKNLLKVEINKEYVEFYLPKDIKEFNTLGINRDKAEEWTGHFHSVDVKNIIQIE